MNNIVVFIPHNMESELIKKSTDLLRIRQADNNIQNIIIVCCPPQKEESNKMPMITISELATVLVDLTIQEVNELSQQVQNFVIPQVSDWPTVSLDNTKKHNYNKFVKQNLKQFNQIKLINKRILFNRTQCK